MNEVSYPSHNYSDRISAPSLIVIHDTEGSAQGALSWLANPASKVSAHIVIDKAGSVFRMVPDDKTAWHVRGYNSVSLGVELEMLSTDPDGTFTQEQLDSCALWVAEKCNEYRIPLNEIVSHASLDPTRRTDPRGFPWYSFLLNVAGNIAMLP